MKRRRSFQLAWFAAVLLLGLPIGCAFSDTTRSIPTQFSQPAVTTMKLESTAFTPNQLIPSTYTCDGKDISPPLSWSSPPEATKSLALIVDDPDAPGRTFVHWVLYNLPPTTQQIPEGLPHQPELSFGGWQGKNDFNRYGYGGPCPPSGTHRYYFKLYALDTELDLAVGVTKSQLLQEMEGHVLAEAELIGHYSRQW